MKKVLVLGIAVLLITPQIALAAWWNPFSWNWRALFQTQPKIEEIEIPVPSEEIIVEPNKTDTQPAVDPVPPKVPQRIPVTVPEPKPTKTELPIDANIPTQTDNSEEISDLIRDMNSLTEKYNGDIQDLDKEILGLEKEFYEYKEAVYKTPTSARVMEGRIAQKLDETNTAIAKLQIEKQEKYYEYSDAYDKLNRELMKLQAPGY